MSCSVYCLVSGIEQRDALMESLECAGIAPDRVTIVWRAPATCLGRADTPWYLPFMPAAWWWWSVTTTTGDDSGTPAGLRANPRVVVPYAMLKARRLRGRHG